MVNVILSGGVGSRLWPLSRKSRPKQYIPLFEGKTLFQLCAARNAPLTDSLLVVGNADNYLLSRQNLESLGFSVHRDIVEAIPRNTAAAIAFAAFALDKEALMLVTPSDHVIGNREEYRQAVNRAAELAAEEYLVTFGVKPTHPETGYGYIEFEGENVITFREKPSFADAEQFIASGRFLWNSGIFCFKAGIFLEELERYEPEIYAKALRAWSGGDGLLDAALSLEIPAKSVDYAVMERSDKIKVIPAAFTWNDLGSYDALWAYMEQEGLATANNLALGTQKHVEFIGVNDLVYVETPDAVMIMDRRNSQEVKLVYERLGREKPELLS